jgi:hypothetical protein
MGLDIARMACSVLAGVSGVVSAFLALYLAVLPPADSAAKQKFIYAAVVLCIVAILASATFFICEFFRDRRRADADRRRDALLQEVVGKLEIQIVPPLAVSKGIVLGPGTRGLVADNDITADVGIEAGEDVLLAAQRNRIKAPTASARSAPSSLRGVALALAKRYRDFANTYSGVEGDDLLSVFWKSNPFQELNAVKKRLENVLGWNSVVSSVDRLPNSIANIQKIADNLEKEALRVKEDVPA